VSTLEERNYRVLSFLPILSIVPGEIVSREKRGLQIRASPCFIFIAFSCCFVCQLDYERKAMEEKEQEGNNEKSKNSKNGRKDKRKSKRNDAEEVESPSTPMETKETKTEDVKQEVQTPKVSYLDDVDDDMYTSYSAKLEQQASAAATVSSSSLSSSSSSSSSSANDEYSLPVFGLYFFSVYLSSLLFCWLRVSLFRGGTNLNYLFTQMNHFESSCFYVINRTF
jgi:hypothetical protein